MMKDTVILNDESPKCKLIDFKSHINTLKTSKTILMCLFLTALYLISGYWKWLEIGVSVCAIVFMAIIPMQSAFCIFMYLHCFTLSNIGYDSCFMVTLIGFCIILFVKYVRGLKRKKYEHHKKIFSCISVFYIFTTLMSFFYSFYRGAFLYFTYLPLIYLIFAMRDEFDIKQGMNFLFGGMIASCALGFIFDFLPGFQYTAFHNKIENRFRGLVNHTNYLSLRAVFVLSYYMYRFLDKKMNWVDFTTTFFICSGITILTKSKTGICLLGLMSVLFLILSLKKDFKNNIKCVCVLLCVCLFMCGVFYKQIWEILQRFGSAFTSDDFFGSLLTGRDEIWSKYLKESFSSTRTILFGHGLLAQQLYIPNVFPNFPFVETHNFYIFLLYRFGLVGTAFLTYIIYSIIKETYYTKPQFIASLPLIFILLESFCDNTFKCYNISFFIFAVMILFATQKEEILKLKKEKESYLKAKEEKKLKRKQFKNAKHLQSTELENNGKVCEPSINSTTTTSSGDSTEPSISSKDKSNIQDITEDNIANPQNHNTK